ncbi:MATE family efflux transporter [Ruminococcus sp. 5_1_39BFAA]|uniref:MATE family efflux transporter n=1 Tax=Ruminococcus sp. 5_1_39BFAA TaxID=457412 RepID=UPI003568FEB7
MEKEFEHVPVKKLILKLGLPAMAAQFFNILYNIIDRIYVGNLPQNGELALASVGICAPALTTVSAFAYLVGTGGSASMSIALGRRDRLYAQKTINNAFVMLLVISAAVTAIALICKRPLLYLLGCSHTMYPFASRYFTIYICGTTAALCGTGMNQFILAQGFSKQGMLSIVIGAIANVVLDPLFIFVFHFGIAGAAAATVLSQILSLCYVLHFLFGNKAPIRIQKGSYQKDIMKCILKIGMMPFFIIVLDNFIIIFLNASLRYHGGSQTGDQYIACAAIVQSFMVIVTCPAQGITTGCGTLYSYHYGAGNYTKVMQVFRYVFLLCITYIGLLFLFAQFAPQFFVRMFVDGAENIPLASSFIRKYTLGLYGIAVQYAIVDGLTAMGKIKYALPISLFRKALYLVLIFFLPFVTDLKNIFYAGSISDILGSCLTIFVFFTIVKKKLKKELC